MASSSRVAFLRRVSVLSGLDDELLSRLSSGRAATQAALVANPDGLRGQVPEGPSPNGAVPADEGPRPGVGA